MSVRSTIQPFFDDQTGTITYVVSDNDTHYAAIIDPVLDFDFKSGSTSSIQVDKVLAYLRASNLKVEWILETHAHADHLTAAHLLQKEVGGRIAIGERIRQVQSYFKELFHLEPDYVPDGRQFDYLFSDNESFTIGSLAATAIFVPGHTPADMAYVVDGAAFVGDTLFMPDLGTARADFPGGDAQALYRSAQRILELPPETKIFVCHDYPPAEREPQWETTVAEQRANNIHVHDGISEDGFVKMRTERDATLDVPTLILPSMQVNIRGGQLPPPEENGRSYLKVPVNALISRPPRV